MNLFLEKDIDEWNILNLKHNIIVKEKRLKLKKIFNFLFSLFGKKDLISKESWILTDWKRNCVRLKPLSDEYKFKKKRNSVFFFRNLHFLDKQDEIIGKDDKNYLGQKNFMSSMSRKRFVTFCPLGSVYLWSDLFIQLKK